MQGSPTAVVARVRHGVAVGIRILGLIQVSQFCGDESVVSTNTSSLAPGPQIVDRRLRVAVLEQQPVVAAAALDHARDATALEGEADEVVAVAEQHRQVLKLVALGQPPKLWSTPHEPSGEVETVDVIPSLPDSSK